MLRYSHFYNLTLRPYNSQRGKNEVPNFSESINDFDNLPNHTKINLVRPGLAFSESAKSSTQPLPRQIWHSYYKESIDMLTLHIASLCYKFYDLTECKVEGFCFIVIFHFMLMMKWTLICINIHHGRLILKSLMCASCLNDLFASNPWT